MKATDSKVLDSSLWLAYFLDGRYREIIEQEKTFLLSTLSLFEIKKKIIRSSFADEHKNRAIEFLKNKTLLIAVDEIIAEKAVECTINYHLGTADSIIYATSLINKATLITHDNDFRDLHSVEVV